MEQKYTGSSWMDYKRMIIWGVFLIIIWGSLLAFFYMKADEVTKDPCSVCAKRMGTRVSCEMEASLGLKRIYYPNGSFFENREEVIERAKEINDDVYKTEYGSLPKNFTLELVN